MKVFINNEPKELQNLKTITELLRDLNLEGAKGIAIAINQEVIPKAHWNNHSLAENDRLTIIRATQGG